MRQVQIEGLGLQPQAVLGEPDRSPGMPGKELIHLTFEVGREVLDQHESDLEIGPHDLEKTLDRFETAGRSAERDDGKVALLGEGCPAVVQAIGAGGQSVSRMGISVNL